jgi:tripartite-type tricarboxylate transporter receptor subunit TctC
MVIRSTRRALLSGLAAVPLVRPRAAHAQADWPTRPVRVMVPYPPAGGADTTARIVYARLSENLGQQFAIENRGGAGGTIGEEAVAKAAPDGYTILHDATAFSVNGSLYANLPFDYRKDFEPVFLVALVPNILVVTPSVPANTVADVIALAKATPGGIDMASSGNGTLQHLLLELFRQRHRDCHQSRALSRRRAGADRCDGRAGEIFLCQWFVGIWLDQGR